MFLTCLICKADIPGPYKMLSKHFRRIHNLKTSNAVRTNLTCGQAGCKTELKSFGSFGGYHIRICDKAQVYYSSHSIFFFLRKIKSFWQDEETNGTPCTELGKLLGLHWPLKMLIGWELLERTEKKSLVSMIAKLLQSCLVRSFTLTIHLSNL